MAEQKRRYLGFFLVGIWILFTVSLVTWWMIFGSQQVERLALLDNKEAAELARYQKMLLMEGATMIVSLFAGGCALFYYLYRQVKEGNRLKIFFASFTHEIKTPLAGASLKLDMLEEKLTDPVHIASIAKVKQEIQRLSMQIENSLFLADEGSAQPIFEAIEVGDFIRAIAAHGWKGIEKITVEGHAVILADRRMLESIVGNIFRNASQHGKATDITVRINASADKKDEIKIRFEDNGSGFTGEYQDLSKLFMRHYPGSGSGIGLYLVNKLSKAMKGKVQFVPSNKGFVIELFFQEAPH